ncbi:hypothetical protein VKT23_017078 [Stygiomarasmius scandens]|uniref:Protein kinase domain-containing protein n=1 Tax=Marasmiellus scandens TaxID=2682957 RepID=A0ABR1IW48_9AGAR
MEISTNRYEVILAFLSIFPIILFVRRLRLFISFFASERAYANELELPSTLRDWRNFDDGPVLWESLRPLLKAVGLEIWQHDPPLDLCQAPSAQLSLRQTGYLFAHTERQDPNSTANGSLGQLRSFRLRNPLFRPARTLDGQDVRIRAIVIKQDGSSHLKILRRLATGANSLISGNHTLPMLREIPLNDIVFAVFPLVGSSMELSCMSWTQNSVEDILEMIMQALEGLVFIHRLGIAHRDAFHDNFLVQWQPESLLAADMFCSRPRVYLIDFEVAVELPKVGPPEQKLCRGLPIGGSYTDPERYARPAPSDVLRGDAYDPFKLDVWQLGYPLVARKFKTRHAEIDGLLPTLCSDDPDLRISSEVALRNLTAAVRSAPSSCLRARPSWYK